MKISAKWVLGHLPWLEDVPFEEVKRRMMVLGHRADISATVWNFEPRPQRPDLNCVTGILREIAAGFGKSIEIPQPYAQDEDIGSIYEQVDADVWSDALCNRLTARMCSGLKAGRTPDWMKERLLAAGLPCLNSVDDLAAYVMLECGQPVFLLDAQAICDSTVTLREAMGCETAEDLELPYGTPILESGDDVLAVPHFWAAPNSAVSDSTEAVFIAAVNYPEDVISLCGEVFGAASAGGFSRDPLLTITAVERVCQLIQQLGYGHILDGTIDILNYVPDPQIMDLKGVNSGNTALSEEEIATLLPLLQITPDGVMPSWRPDLDTPEAVQQEILRLHRANTPYKE